MSASLLLPSEQRPIPLRRRLDLVVSESTYQGEPSWIVKDPVGMKYFRLLEPEHEAFQMLDGRASYRDVKRRLDQRFPQFEFKLDDVHALVNSFHESGLLISQSVGQADPLNKRRNKELKRKSAGLLMSALSLRFPGVDPERFLSWLYPKVCWLFSPLATTLLIGLCISAGVLVLQNLEEFYRRLPEFGQFFDLNNIFFLAVILIITKSIHELGHGLMCKHFGGECHEMGFMLLVMTPAMYCNTSDSWVLPNKWHRIAIGAAGMYVEIVLAAAATFVWWYTQPCAIHYLALNVIFLCSVSTLLFNANPLLRYDGYYMLSDYLEIPNLAQKSKTALLSKLRVWCLGMDPIESRLQPTRHQISFTLYSIAAFVYRWLVILLIFWFLSGFFEPYGLTVLAYLMISMSVVGMVVMPLIKLVKFFSYPGRMRDVKKPRFLISLAVLSSLFGLLFWFPLPHSVSGNFVITPVEAQNVFVDQPGVLRDVHFEPGEQIQAGDVIAELENEDIAIALAGLKGNLASLKSDLAAFRLDPTKSSSGSRMIAETKLKITDVEQRIKLVHQQLDSLKLIAARDGKIIAAPNRVSEQNAANERTLVRWSGLPTDRENREAYLDRGTLFCLVADPQQVKAVLVVEESVAKLVAAGQPVELMLDEYAGAKFHGEVQSISRKPLELVPRELSINNGGPIATQPAIGGAAAPMIASYEATVQLKDLSQLLKSPALTGFRGRAKIKVGQMPLGQRFLRYLKSVINFR